MSPALHRRPEPPLELCALCREPAYAESTRRSNRLLDRRRKLAAFRDPHKNLDHFGFAFNPKMNRSLVFDPATGAFIGPP
jgi:hypothetical protein